MKSLSLKVGRLEGSQTLAFTMKAEEMRRRGIDVVSLTVGEPDFPTPPHVKMAAVRAIDENFTKYTPNAGIPELLQAIVKKFREENNLVFDPSQILVSCGGKHSCYNALQAICNPGDEVVIPAPYWVTYPEIVKLVDAKPIVVATTLESNFKLSPLQLRKAINAKTKAFIFNSPCNPTGSVYSQGEIEELADVIKETGIYVISDEIYEKIVYDGVRHFSIGSVKEIRDQVITVNGVSKGYSMTGWRIGYLGAPEPVARAAAKIQGQVTSNASSISQKAATAALAGPQTEVGTMLEQFKRRREFVYGKLSRIQGLSLCEPKGAFYLFPSVEKFTGKRVDGELLRNDEDICHFLLEKEHVAAVPGSAFGARNFLRISYACSMRDLEKGVARLASGFRKLREGY